MNDVAIKILNTASKCTSRRQACMLRGKFDKAIHDLPWQLFESAMDEFNRQIPERLPR